MNLRRPHWSFMGRLALVIFLLPMVLRALDIPTITRYFTLCLLGIMASAQPLVLLCLSMLALRLAILARTPAVPFIPAFKAIMLAIGMNAVLPGRIAELLKPTFLMKQIVLPMSAGLAAVFYRAHG